MPAFQQWWQQRERDLKALRSSVKETQNSLESCCLCQCRITRTWIVRQPEKYTLLSKQARRPPGRPPEHPDPDRGRTVHHQPSNFKRASRFLTTVVPPNPHSVCGGADARALPEGVMGRYRVLLSRVDTIHLGWMVAASGAHWFT